MAADGLYLETVQPWGRLCKQLWKSDRGIPLPYGHMEERDDFLSVFLDHVIPIVLEHMVEKAAAYAERRKEWAGFIAYDNGEFVPQELQMSVSDKQVRFKEYMEMNNTTDSGLVADIHSHHTMPPFFSFDDNRSDVEGTKLSLVIGNYRLEDGKPRFDMIGRYAVEGFFFDLPSNLLVVRG